TVTFTVANTGSPGVSITRVTDGIGANSGDAVKRFVDAKIAITPSAVNKVGDLHTFTVNVQQDDGLVANATGGDASTGFGGVSGLHPTVTLTPTNNAVITNKTDNCAATAGTDSSGNCTV